MSEIKDLTKKVNDTLRDFPETRNSDIELTIRIWKEHCSKKLRSFEGADYVLLSDLFVLPREDNIKRIRAKIQNEDNEYLPTVWKIAQARRIKEDIWREHLGLQPRKQVLDLR